MKDIRTSINKVREDSSRIAVYLDEMTELADRTYHDVIGFELSANATIQEKKQIVDFIEHAEDRCRYLESCLYDLRRELKGGIK